MNHSILHPERILSLIDASGITKKEIATRCEITTQSIDNFVNGADMGIQKVARLADFFDVSVDYFFDHKEKPIQIGHNVHGNGNNVTGDITLSECQRELGYLKKEIEHYKEILQEKERTIRILMETQEYFNKNV